jgi:hypothetical protein
MCTSVEPNPTSRSTISRLKHPATSKNGLEILHGIFNLDDCAVKAHELSGVVLVAVGFENLDYIKSGFAYEETCQVGLAILDTKENPRSTAGKPTWRRIHRASAAASGQEQHGRYPPADHISSNTSLGEDTSWSIAEAGAHREAGRCEAEEGDKQNAKAARKVRYRKGMRTAPG